MMIEYPLAHRQWATKIELVSEYRGVKILTNCLKASLIPLG